MEEVGGTWRSAGTLTGELGHNDDDDGQSDGAHGRQDAHLLPGLLLREEPAEEEEMMKGLIFLPTW